MRSSARQPSTNRRPPGPAPRPLHYREFTGVCPPPWMVRRRGRARTCNIRFQRPSCCQIASPAYTIVACTAAMVTVCAPNHPLDTLRRCRRRRALPACTPPCSAWSATTRWMPQGPEHVPDARRDPHAQRVAYLAYPPGIRTRISTHRGRRAAITPTGHSHPIDTPVIENHGIPANWACLALGLRA